RSCAGECPAKERRRRAAEVDARGLRPHRHRSDVERRRRRRRCGRRHPPSDPGRREWFPRQHRRSGRRAHPADPQGPRLAPEAGGAGARERAPALSDEPPAGGLARPARRLPAGGAGALRIAQVAPLAESVPPRLYGGTERVVAWLIDELVALGHEVTLIASGDSRTPARLIAAWPRALRLGRPHTDPMAAQAALLETMAHRAREGDVIHCPRNRLP